MKTQLGISYDMQKLDEAVTALAGHGRLQSRLEFARIPLAGLNAASGLNNKKRTAEFEQILEALDDAGNLDDEAARQLARAIVDLQNGNWHDAVYQLEDEVERLKEKARK